MHTEEINRYFETHRTEFLADLARLVAVDSVKGKKEPGKPFGDGPACALELALCIAERYGLYTENWENYLGIVQLAPGSARRLDILAHLDVVPACAETWTVTAPFTMKEVDGRVYGRGVMDDKGPALAAIYALRAIRELRLPCRHPVRVFLGCDEESGASELRYYFNRTQAADMTLSPDAGWPVINLEKGIMTGTIRMPAITGKNPMHVLSVKGGKAVNAVPGECEIQISGFGREELEEMLARAAERTGAAFRLLSGTEGEFAVHISGAPAHAAMPEKGNNAVTAALGLLAGLPLPEGEEKRLWAELAALFPHGDFRGEALGIDVDHPLTGPLSLSLNMIRWGKDGLWAVFDARLPIGFGSEQIAQLEGRIQNCGFTFEHSEAMPHYVPENSPFIQSLLAAYEEFTGQKGFCCAIGGLTYCHNIENAVAFGMENGETDNHLHGNDEFAEVAELLRGGKIYTSAILRLCGGWEADQEESV